MALCIIHFNFRFHGIIADGGDDRKISIQAARLLLGSLSLHFFALSFRTNLAHKVHLSLFHVLIPSHFLLNVVSGSLSDFTWVLLPSAYLTLFWAVKRELNRATFKILSGSFFVWAGILTVKQVATIFIGPIHILGRLGGNFDPMDIVAYWLGAFLGQWVWRKTFSEILPEQPDEELIEIEVPTGIDKRRIKELFNRLKDAIPLQHIEGVRKLVVRMKPGFGNKITPSYGLSEKTITIKIPSNDYVKIQEDIAFGIGAAVYDNIPEAREIWAGEVGHKWWYSAISLIPVILGIAPMGLSVALWRIPIEFVQWIGFAMTLASPILMPILLYWGFQSIRSRLLPKIYNILVRQGASVASARAIESARLNMAESYRLYLLHREEFRSNAALQANYRAIERILGGQPDSGRAEGMPVLMDDGTSRQQPNSSPPTKRNRFLSAA